MKTLIINTAIISTLTIFFSLLSAASLSGHVKAGTTEYTCNCFIAESIYEKQPSIEAWMKTPDYFSTSIFFEVNEPELPISYWMHQPQYFYPVILNQVFENNISIEAWMKDTGYFYNPANETAMEDALSLEGWMLDLNYF